VSSRLAKQGAHHLEGLSCWPTELGPPALADALAIFECAAEAAHEGGDHAILVGRVLRFAKREVGEPLVFFRGRYGALAGTSG
jgi:flavin reductase (DIM6/NTAB) family NADH-FMN oxidoreductase RutF